MIAWMCVCSILGVLIAFPIISLWLPSMMR